MPRFLHTRIRVSDLDYSADWYCKHLGFQIKSKTAQSPDGNRIVMLELPGNEHSLELTWSANYDLKVPEDLMHMAISVPELPLFCDKIEKAGIEIWPDNWRDKLAAGSRMVFIDDPDGYEIELIEEKN